MTSPEELLAGTLAADHPRIVALAASVANRARAGRPVDRERVLLGELIERSQKACAARRARIPVPRFPEELPIAQHRDEIAKLIAAHPVTIVCGETGSGKTTQIPKICLGLGRGAAGLDRLHAAAAHRRTQPLPAPGRGAAGNAQGFRRPQDPLPGRRRAPDTVRQGDDRRRAARRDPLGPRAARLRHAHRRRGPRAQPQRRFPARVPASASSTMRPELKVIVTSATIDTERFSQFFDGAPVIEVSGRTYPVEVRYRPEFFEVEEEDDEPVDMNEAIATRRGRDQARQAAPATCWSSCPASARSARPPRRCASSAAPRARRRSCRSSRACRPRSRTACSSASAHRRIVLATNVAETSLTVPGIHYVIDTGLARVKRYSPRQKIDQLRIEPISQAAARQRAGRCGRVASGIAIRLYAEDGFQRAPRFHHARDPAHLARIGDPAHGGARTGRHRRFPVHRAADAAPDRGRLPAALRAGRHRRASANSRPWATSWRACPWTRASAACCCGAREFNCATEMMILAAALSIPDPRDRPQSMREASDRAHEEFRDDASDFLQLLNLWKFFDNEFVHKKSNRKLYETCREHFLSYVRMREWRDLAGQLREMAVGVEAARERHAGHLRADAPRAAHGPHRQRGHEGARRRPLPRPARLAVPRVAGIGTQEEPPALGHGRASCRRPRAIFARNVARIEPEWIEKAAAHLVERAWVEPHWDKGRGEVVAYENVTLYGLVLAARRKVSFGRLDPVARARNLHRGRAGGGRVRERRIPFWAHNRKLIAEVEELEHRARRPDVLVDDRADLRVLRALDSGGCARRALLRGVVSRGRTGEACRESLPEDALALPREDRSHAPRRRIGHRGALSAPASRSARRSSRSPTASSPATRWTASRSTFRSRC